MPAISSLELLDKIGNGRSTVCLSARQATVTLTIQKLANHFKGVAILYCKCQELKPKGETNTGSSLFILHPCTVVDTVGSHRKLSANSVKLLTVCNGLYMYNLPRAAIAFQRLPF